MSRYIDADATRDLLIKSISLTNGIDTALKDAPSIDIVRCKECKHREKYPCNEIEFYECSHLRLYGTKVGVEDDWFCADGERKESE